MINILRSIKTALWIMGISMLLFIAGSMYIPKNLEIFSEINDMPLFQWLSQNSEHVVKTYWIHVSLALMACLSLNMVVCTIYELKDRFTVRTFVQRLSPQILHVGVLLVLFGHLVSGMAGYKKDISLQTGNEYTFGNLSVTITNVSFTERKGEDQRRYEVEIRLVSEKGTIQRVIAPAQPVFIQGTGVFVKSAEENGRVLIGLVRDPGVKWEIAGAIMFLIGSLGIFWSRFSLRG